MASGPYPGKHTQNAAQTQQPNDLSFSSSSSSSLSSSIPISSSALPILLSGAGSDRAPTSYRRRASRPAPRGNSSSSDEGIAEDETSQADPVFPRSGFWIYGILAIVTFSLTDGEGCSLGINGAKGY